ncbi:MAG: 4-aminobutyrate--2-oxoglutarate transaminase [Rhodobiaceae bacterium]|nr:4-aminobutyrate--2-oxoglutarate transaminase [Rhodobiaceae bacterium]MCC0054106.1 4-aminobutyrate--2-oxoglutarate transaminase [Rhodobiaceae bacterium]
MSNANTAALAGAETGATNAELQSLRESAVPRGVATMLPVFAERALNSEIWDVEGNRYIDFGSGIAVLNTGHMHPRVTGAVREQLDKFSHSCFQVTPYETYVRLADRLNTMAPGKSPKKTIFLTTGAEAVENAVKIARAHTKRAGVIAFSGGFHGRTMMGMALTGKVVPYKTGFGPFPGEVYHLPFPVAYHGVSAEMAIASLETLFKADIEPGRVAAIIVEPVQGEGGFYVAPPEFMKRLREICTQHGIVFIVDEIQTGFARTGKMLAVEHSEIEPDLITMAKSLAGGFPLSAVTGKAEIMDGPEPGGLGGTYGGPPLACAAAHAVLDVIADEKLCERAVEIGKLMTDELKAMQATNELRSVIGDVRGLGAMVAMELVQDGDASKPAADMTKALVKRCADRGLVILACGVRGNVIRFLVPLTASDEIIREGLGIVADELKGLARAAA